MNAMITVIALAVLYGGALALFRSLGGLGAAGELFERWGRASSSLRSRGGSASEGGNGSS